MNEKKLEWESIKVKSFIDEVGTKFIKGPFKYKENLYDWKFIINGEEDFCNNQQIKDWNIEVVKIIQNI